MRILPTKKSRIVLDCMLFIIILSMITYLLINNRYKAAAGLVYALINKIAP